MLGWSCEEECRYSCQWDTIDFLTTGPGENPHGIPQFYGKWTFTRILGIQVRTDDLLSRERNVETPLWPFVWNRLIDYLMSGKLMNSFMRDSEIRSLFSMSKCSEVRKGNNVFSFSLFSLLFAISSFLNDLHNFRTSDIDVQEPASALFSLLNLVTTFLGWRDYHHRVRSLGKEGANPIYSQPYFALTGISALLAINAWYVSRVFVLIGRMFVYVDVLLFLWISDPCSVHLLSSFPMWYSFFVSSRDYVCPFLDSLFCVLLILTLAKSRTLESIHDILIFPFPHSPQVLVNDLPHPRLSFYGEDGLLFRYISCPV